MNSFPKIRFRGYTDKWEIKTFKDLFVERHQFGNISKEYPQLSFTIADGVINPEDRKTNNRDFLIIDKENKKYLITEYNDIIYNPANVVHGAIHRNSLKKGVVSPIYRIFFTDQNPLFMEYIVRNPNFIKQISRRTEGTVTKLKTLKPESFLAMESFISTSKSEQEKIGDFLYNVDKLIKSQTKKIDELKLLKNSLLFKMFPTEQELIPKLRFNIFQEDWNKMKLNEISKYITSNFTISDSNPEARFDLYDANNIIGKVSNGVINEEYITIIKDGAGVGKVRRLPKNTAFIGTMGGIVAKKSNIDFLYCSLLKTDFTKEISGATIPHIYYSNYGNNEYLVPSLKEQEKIGEMFKNLDNLISLYQSKLEKLNSLKIGLLNIMFVKEV